MKPYDMLFLDVETGGRDVKKHAITEIAAIRCDATGENVLATFESRVQCYHPIEADAAALNGYTPEGWQDAPEPRDAIEKFLEAVVRPYPETRIALCGHNVKFDEEFVLAMLAREGYLSPFDYHRVDTVTLAWPLLAAGKISSLKLRDVCAYLGISNEVEHRAMADAVRQRMAYLRLMKMFVVPT